jgi:SOS-response transcriptional repressor LexA
MSAKERLLVYLDYLVLGQNAFEKKVGVAIGYISHNKGSFGSSVVQKISTTYPELNMEWLLYGDGQMLKGESIGRIDMRLLEQDVSYVPLLPISAQGGSLDDFMVTSKNSEHEMVVSPIRGADFAITVSGESMFPEYPSGSQIIIKRINERAFIDWGKTYVLDTCNGTVVKRLFPSDSKNPNLIKCVSTNPDYPPFEVNLSEDVYGIYRVLMCMSVK